MPIHVCVYFSLSCLYFIKQILLSIVREFSHSDLQHNTYVHEKTSTLDQNRRKRHTPDLLFFVLEYHFLVLDGCLLLVFVGSLQAVILMVTQWKFVGHQHWLPLLFLDVLSLPELLHHPLDH